MDSQSYSLLLEAYNYYHQKGSKHFKICPKKSEHYLQILSAILDLESKGYITNLSDTCHGETLSIVPPEGMSFDITLDGICYAAENIR